MLFPFEKIRVKPGTVLIDTVLSGDPPVQLVLSPPTIIQTYAFHTFIPPKQPCSSSLVTYSQVQRQYTQVYTYSKRKDQRPFIVTFLLLGQITILQTYLSFQTKTRTSGFLLIFAKTNYLMEMQQSTFLLKVHIL